MYLRRKKSKPKNNKNKISVNYTRHTLERMDKRVISKSEIEEALRFGRFLVQGSMKFEVVYKDVLLIVKETKKNRFTVITVMNEKNFEEEVKKMSKELDISIREASKRVKNIECIGELYQVQ